MNVDAMNICSEDELRELFDRMSDGHNKESTKQKVIFQNRVHLNENHSIQNNKI